MAKFAERIKELRERLGLSQDAFAEKLGTYKGTISRYENGHRVPDLNDSIKIATMFNVSLDWLSGRTNDPNPYIITTKNIPELSHINADIIVTKEAYESGLTPEEIQEVLEFAAKLKKK